MTGHPLDRPVWNMLHGPQASLATGGVAAVRIDPGYGPFAAACDTGEDAQAALAALLAGPDDEIWIVEREAWPAPAGTREVRRASLVQMIAPSPAPIRDEDEVAALLGDADAAQMSELALATAPGPWGPLTRLYGSFYGIRRQVQLAAMAGERMRPAAEWCEVSGVSTWPAYRGLGLAALLIRTVMAGIRARGATPFLHSYAENAGAIRLYGSLGFEIRCEMVATVLAKA